MIQARGLLARQRTRRDATFVVMCLLAFAGPAGMAATSEPASRPTSRPTSAPAAVDPNSLPGRALSTADDKALHALFAKMRAAFARTGEQALPAFMTDEEARLAKPIGEANSRNLTKVKAMLETAKAKHVPMPARRFNTDRFSATLTTPDDQIHFRQMDANSAVGFPPPSASIEFRRVAGQWKYTRELTADAAKSEVELADAFGKAFDEITAGLKDGTITADNWRPKTDEIIKNAIVPIIRKAWRDVSGG